MKSPIIDRRLSKLEAVLTPEPLRKSHLLAARSKQPGLRAKDQPANANRYTYLASSSRRQKQALSSLQRTAAAPESD